MIISRIVKTTTAACVLGLTLAAPALAEKTIRLSILHPEDPYNNAQGAMATVFKSLVEVGTNGSVNVQIFPDGTLGKDNEVIQQMRDGIIQANISSSGGLAQHYPLMGIFDMPFLYANIADAQDVVSLESDFGKMFAADIEEKLDVEVLGMIEAEGFFSITNSVRPIETLEDMAELKIRTMTLPTHEELIRSLGGAPTPLPWPEVYTALQTGVVDGQMNPIPIVAHAKFSEVQEYLTITQHLLTPYTLMMNSDFYNSLTDEERYVVDYAARSAVYAGKGIGRINEASDKGLAGLREAMKVNMIAPAELERFAEAAQPAVLALIEEKFGQEGLDMVNALQAEIARVSGN
ncbi:DctP family TRAP transporter solute-binding subunit (plasmid) [Leisingera sp. M527]|uniref:TRAP transporter substrate-binding protein n=1 Tax=Leisingera sp. M527 TaxID=2867014 RepID=UPI0021A592C7|nr:DctP family TRAP transporter solute-binding subunit [Leisingera sp. M527]UWQ35389.1 DctP family TRAP transporter solute-binding subunit [Leisingera sp. M527]